MSGGGGKLEVINTRERAVSQDINRLQAFLQYDRAEILRRLVDCRSTVSGFTDGGGTMEAGSFVDTTAQDTAAVGTPLRGDVIEGLVVLPQPGSLNLLVSPGAVVLDDPDGQAGSSDPNPPNPDDSRLKLVVDPGVVISGSLAITAGAGSTRIDVIECQRTTSVVETDNRDIFDPSTGLFSAVSVTKVTEGRLTYRVRAGTPGAGLPANVQGWLPLCVASVPASATSVDDCLFWDVRPLVKDRVAPPTDLQSVIGAIDPASYLTSNDFTDIAKTNLLGVIQSRAGMYVAGGTVTIDAQDVNNQAAGASFSSLALWYLYAIFPGSLPRWVPYAAFPSPRIPSGPRGILAVSNTGPVLDVNLISTQTIAPPSITGITGAQPAVYLTSGISYDIGGGSPVPAGITHSAGEIVPANTLFLQGPAPSNVGGADGYALVAGTHFPVGAKAVKIAVATRLVGTPAQMAYWASTLDVYASSSFLGAEQIGTQLGNISLTIIDGSNHATLLFETWIPRTTVAAFNGYANDNLYFVVSWGVSAVSGPAITRDNQNLQVRGWKV